MSTGKFNKNMFSNITIDSITEFANKYLYQIFYTFVFILILLFSIILTGNLAKKKTEIKTSILYQAMNYAYEGRNDQAISMLKDVYENSSEKEEIKSISGFQLGQLLLENDKQDEAFDIYYNIYNFKNNDKFIKDLSGLTALNILVSENDKEKYSKTEELIKELSKPENLLLSLVEEQEALFELQKGNDEKGIEILKNLLNKNIDENTRYRVDSLIKSYENVNKNI